LEIARRSFQSVIDIDPGYVEAYEYLYNVYMKDGDYTRAEGVMKILKVLSK